MRPTLFARAVDTVRPSLLLLCLSFSCAALGQTYPMPEPCPEGLYRDYSVEPAECRYLDLPMFGAEVSIPEVTYTLDPSRCNREALNELVQTAAANGGGTVRLPACSIEIKIPIYLPGNIALRGAGAGKTILYPNSVNYDKLLTVKRVSNSVVSDMTFDGYDRLQHNVEIRYASNVILERIEAKRAAGSGIVFYQSHNVTIRYSLIHDINYPSSRHGIGSKDCYPGQSDFTSTTCEYRLQSQAENDFSKPPFCNQSYCPCTMALTSEGFGTGSGHCFGYGSMYTQHYSIYSNFLRDIDNEYCAAIHARNGEFAGNVCEGARHGLKVPDAWDVYIHNNLYRNNAGWGIHTYGPVKGIHPRRIRVYTNHFVNNGDVPVRAEGPEKFYVIHNLYENNCSVSTNGYCAPGDDYIVNTYEKFSDGSTRNPDTYICGGFTQEDVLLSEGKFGPTSPRYADSGTCYAALPVELVDFAASADHRSADIRFGTASETNNAGFELEHSIGGHHQEPTWTPWRQIGFVAGAGTTTEARSYTYRVADLDPGRHRFRLKQVDFDGMYSFSPMVEVAVDVPGGFRFAPFYPNPFNPRAATTITVSETQRVRVEVFDATGRMVSTLFDESVEPNTPTRVTFEGAHLPSGTYLVRATGRTTETSHVITLAK